ncbi:MAG TPA: hypothetical protein VFH61_11140 [Thermoleophilia bacterium]|nr:hypothetical protein [Thermoleophilia bacterium]
MRRAVRRTAIVRPSWPLFGPEDRLTAATKVELLYLTPAQGLYLRDLMCKGLGVVRADMYVGMLLDGKISSVSGYHCADWRRHAASSGGPFELFGFSMRVPYYPRLNKLHMMVLTSSTFPELCRKRWHGVPWPITTFETTCIAKGHEQHGNRGVLKLAGRELLPNGYFRLSYKQPYRKWDAQEALRLFLKREKYDPETGEHLGK